MSGVHEGRRARVLSLRTIPHERRSAWRGLYKLFLSEAVYVREVSAEREVQRRQPERHVEK